MRAYGSAGGPLQTLEAWSAEVDAASVSGNALRKQRIGAIPAILGSRKSLLRPSCDDDRQAVGLAGPGGLIGWLAGSFTGISGGWMPGASVGVLPGISGEGPGAGTCGGS
jgi:hypothetical protein